MVRRRDRCTHGQPNMIWFRQGVCSGLFSVLPPSFPSSLPPPSPPSLSPRLNKLWWAGGGGRRKGNHQPLSPMLPPPPNPSSSSQPHFIIRDGPGWLLPHPHGPRQPVQSSLNKLTFDPLSPHLRSKACLKGTPPCVPPVCQSYSAYRTAPPPPLPSFPLRCLQHARELLSSKDDGQTGGRIDR